MIIVESRCQCGYKSELYLEVRLIEVIRNIPSDLAIFPSLLNDGVEEGQDENEAGERLMATFHKSRSWNLKVCVPQVQLQSVRWFSHNL